MTELYTLAGSLHSRAAVGLLRRADIDFVERNILLDAPPWVQSAPTLVVGWSKYVGLESICKYVARLESPNA